MAGINDEPVWRAVFPDGTGLDVFGDGWTAFGGTEKDRNALVRRFTGHLNDVPWPQIAGFSYDTTPGWNADLMYPRLAAMGAMFVFGPEPASEAPPDVPDTIVG